MRWHRCDLLDAKQRSLLIAGLRPELLLHLAWYVNPADYKTSPENARWADASASLLQEFAEQGGRRALVAGTSFEYAPSGRPANESSTPIQPSTPYAEAKVALHDRLTEILHDVSWAWARIFFMYGPYEPATRLVPYVIRSLLQGEEARCSSGEQVRDFLHVQDVGDALVQALLSEVEGRLNIASGQGVSVRELVTTIGRLIGREDLLRFGAVSSASEAPSLVADTGRLNLEVGFKPRYNLNNGLSSTIQWWRERMTMAGTP